MVRRHPVVPASRARTSFTGCSEVMDLLAGFASLLSTSSPSGRPGVEAPGVEAPNGNGGGLAGGGGGKAPGVESPGVEAPGVEAVEQPEVHNAVTSHRLG